MKSSKQNSYQVVKWFYSPTNAAQNYKSQWIWSFNPSKDSNLSPGAKSNSLNYPFICGKIRIPQPQIGQYSSLSCAPMRHLCKILLELFWNCVLLQAFCEIKRLNSFVVVVLCTALVPCEVLLCSTYTSAVPWILITFLCVRILRHFYCPFFLFVIGRQQ